MVIEHVEPIGIAKASKAVDNEVFRSTGAAGVLADGDVGVVPCPHAMASTAIRMIKELRTEQLEDRGGRILRETSPKDCYGRAL